MHIPLRSTRRPSSPPSDTVIASSPGPNFSQASFFAFRSILRKPRTDNQFPNSIFQIRSSKWAWLYVYERTRVGVCCTVVENIWQLSLRWKPSGSANGQTSYYTDSYKHLGVSTCNSSKAVIFSETIYMDGSREKLFSTRVQLS